MGSETTCILPISLFLVAMMSCVTTFDNFMDLASVLTNSTIPINDTTCSWCSHLLKGDTTAENGLVQDDQVMSDGSSCLSLLGLLLIHLKNLYAMADAP